MPGVKEEDLEPDVPRLRVALLPGDGIGPEVVGEARRVLEATEVAGGVRLDVEEFPHGADHYLSTGETLGEEAFSRLRDEFDAILFGAVGDPRVPDGVHARDILLGLRRRLDLYVNYRPVRLRAPDLSPLRRAEAGVHVELFRENTEGMYSGAGGRLRRGTSAEVAVSEGIATRQGVERLVRAAFGHARRTGRRRLTLAHKSNAVPHMYGLWEEVFEEVGAEYEEMRAESRYADALAMELVRDPGRFQVIVAENLLGDVLSDLIAELLGGPGLAPSANRNPGRYGLYEPVHGSAPDLAGTGEANPVAAVLSAALLLRDCGAEGAAERVEAAVDAALEAGVRTPDLGGTATTEEVGRWIARQVSGSDGREG